MNIIENYSPNFSLPKRPKKRIKFIIIHYTGMKKELDSIKRLQDPKFKVSSHYLIKRNGEILILVPEFYVAWHAGLSNWKNYRRLNKNSIGIELTNPGHQHGYKNFSKKQIFSLRKLLKYLIKNFKIEKKSILGHSDISPDRKKDPGEKFPWRNLAKNGLVWSHNLDLKKIKKLRKIKLFSKSEKDIFIKNLYKIGYKKIKGLKSEKNSEYLTKAFQRRFRQDLVDGKIDQECLKISKNLVSQ
tara:strand:+ start:1850 stop:2578 length:729 start_codon:yes stop_codon:yes gene_type:complete